ncbi:hypothetical protein L1887_43656 [Cichorium endivia]|nr:hypothetical protein L1887_43656 [Cichorium endivia]
MRTSTPTSTVTASEKREGKVRRSIVPGPVAPMLMLLGSEISDRGFQDRRAVCASNNRSMREIHHLCDRAGQQPSLHARPKFRPSSLSLPRREQPLIVAAGFAHMPQGHLGFPMAAAQSLRSSESFSSSHTWLIGGKHRRPSWRRSIANPLANPALYLAKPSRKIHAGSHAHMPDCVPLPASQHRAGTFLSLQCPTG